MPRAIKGTQPAYRLHTSGQVVVTGRILSGNRRDSLLGPRDTAESKTD